MKSKRLWRAIVATVIAVLLVGAYVIVAKNRSATVSAVQQAPSGFMH